jgi:4-amino-4-deoxy-L-arabinose transferase-like glycosyltransferase
VNSQRVLVSRESAVPAPIIFAVIALGFALRLWRLAHLGDLEFDEIVSVRYATLPGDALLAQLAGALFEHPPAFYLALGWWREAFGTADTVARLFSVIPGTLCIPLVYAVSRRLFPGREGRLAGLFAAILVSIAPLPLFYSREVRMYALVTVLGLATLWLFLRGVTLYRPDRPTSRTALWVAYGLLGALTAYVHYLGALQIAALAMAAVLLRRSVPHAVRPVLLSTGAIVALALPWGFAARGTRQSLPALSAQNLVDLPPALWSAWRDLASGPEAGGLAATVGALSLFWLALAGLPRSPVPRTVVTLLLGAGLLGLLSVVALGKPVQARYVLPVTPLVLVLAGATLSRGGPAALTGAAGLLLGFASFWLPYYGGYARADYSAITGRIATLERPGDGVLLTGPWQAWYFDYYYPRSGGTLSHRVLPPNAPPALDPAVTAGELEALAREHRRLWFVQAGLAQADPTNYVERWLQRHAWPATREAHQNAVLSHYALQPPQVTRPLRPVTFGDRLRLSGGWVDGEEIPAGDVVRLTLQWESLQTLPVDYKASLRLVGLDGQRTAVDFDLVEHTEEGERGTAAWAPGRRVSVRRAIWAPASLGPQPYSVRLVLYDPATLTPLAPSGPGAAGGAAGGSGEPGGQPSPSGEAAVGEVYVTQSLAALPAGAEAAYRPVSRRFGGGDDFDAVHLVGVRQGQPDPGTGPVDFDLLWRLDGVSGTEHRSTVSVVDGAGTVWVEETRSLFGGTFAMHDWREGETLAERRAVDLTSLPPGRYRVRLGLTDARGQALPLEGGAPSQGVVEIAAFSLPYRPPLSQRLSGRADAVLRRLAGLLGA